MRLPAKKQQSLVTLVPSGIWSLWRVTWTYDSQASTLKFKFMFKVSTNRLWRKKRPTWNCIFAQKNVNRNKECWETCFFLDRHCHRVFFFMFCRETRIGARWVYSCSTNNQYQYYQICFSSEYQRFSRCTWSSGNLLNNYSFNINKTNLWGKLSEKGCEFLACQYSTRRNSLKPSWS